MAVCGTGDIGPKTIGLLEHRLQRVEFLLGGSNEPSQNLREAAQHGKDQTIPARLARLEVALAQLSSKSRTIQDLLRLCTHHPEIFLPTAMDDSQASFSKAEQLSIVNSCATLYATTASRLTSIQDLPIPSVDLSASIISLHPRLTKVEQLRESQSQEIANLRIRTASVLHRWYEVAVLDGGECWTAWEDRVNVAEKAVRRKELALLRDTAEM